MKPRIYHTDWSAMLAVTGRPLSVSDFMRASPGVPKATVDARIRALVLDGTLSRIGRGMYTSTPKPLYSVTISPWMKEVSTLLTDSLPGVNHCIGEREGNLIVETDKCDMLRVQAFLMDKYGKVAFKKDADRFPGPLSGYILVGQLISESPLLDMDGCPVPSLEKDLVDQICGQEALIDPNPIQRAMEIYPLNTDKLRRYASRRNARSKVDDYLAKIDKTRVEMFSSVQNYLSKTDIVRAWVFGSFARREETPQSDLDLLVSYDPSKRISLLTTIRYKLDLEQIIGRDVDLVEDGYLKPFAVASADKDKYLIYER